MGSPAFPKLRGTDAQASRVQDNVSQQLQPVATALAATPIMGAAPPPWILPSLLNGWAPYGGEYSVPAYHKDALGYVHVKGLLINNSGGPLISPTPIMVLPPNYRPLATLRFAVAGIVATLNAISVDRFGNVTNNVSVAAGGSCDFNFSFLAEA